MILKLNPVAGDDFDSFFQSIVTLAKELAKGNANSLMEYKSDLYFSLDSEVQEKLITLVPDFPVNGTWKEKSPFYHIFGEMVMADFLKTLSSSDEFEIHSKFNDYNIVIKGNCKTGDVTSFEEVLEQKKIQSEQHKKEWEEWLLTKEGKEYTAKQEKEKKKQEEKEKEFKSLIDTVSFQFNEGGEEKWNKGLEVNTDFYGRGIFNYAKVWAYLMEQEMVDEVLTEEIKERCASKADGEGITGFMYGAAVSILRDCWKYGNQLNSLHNKQYNYEGDGTVNPAVLTLSVKD